MKKYEIESLLKSFFIFFMLQVILLSIIMLQNFRQGVNGIDEQVLSQMKICSYDLKCEGFELDFIDKNKDFTPNTLYRLNDIYTLFEVPTADAFLLKVILPQTEYKTRINTLKSTLLQEFILYAFLIALLSFLFSLYALRPLKKALDLNEEFVKDILHDINTPLSSMVVNFSLFKKEIGTNRKIERMEHSVSTILSLQDNLQAFLDHSALQEEELALPIMIASRIAYFQGLYPTIHFRYDTANETLKTNKKAFVRILDNLLSNACKYSPKDAIIKVYTKDSTLYIQDNGQGIKDVKKVFTRYYKENARGVGIGMHIVKKLCDSLKTPIKIDSVVGKGTTIMIDLKEVIVK